ncbi:MAG: hypothetical protein K8J09_19540 [Planctomycetes bacterium]|nr:hypothetical protein [Planctomycetota bacterium]
MLFLVALTATLGATAQQAPLRSYHPSRAPVTVSGHEGMLLVTPKAGGPAELSWITDGVAGVPTLLLPFAWVGGITAMTGPHCLVSGRSATTPEVGWIARVELDHANSRILLQESVQLPLVDAIDIAWHPSMPFLMVVDGIHEELLFAPLLGVGSDPADPILPPASLFATALTAAQAPMLTADVPALRFQDGELLLGRREGYGRPWHRVTLDAAGWHLVQVAEPRANTWMVDVSAGAAGPMRVMSPAAAPGADMGYQVVHQARGVVVSTGEVTSVGAWVEVSAPSAFQDLPGDAFQVVGSLSATSESVRPVIRYGQTGETAALRVGRAQVLAQSLQLGSGQMHFWADIIMPAITNGTVADPPVASTFYLLIGVGFRGPGAPADPIVVTEDGARLQFVLALAGNHNQTTHSEAIGVRIPQPTEQSLEGLIVFTQWAILDPENQQFVYSDVVGARIGPGSAAMTAMSGPAAATSSVVPTAVRRHRAVQWLAADPRRLPAGAPVLSRLRAAAGM